MLDRRPHPIRWLRERPTYADALLAVALTSIALTLHLADFENDDIDFVDPSWWTSLLVVGAVFPILWRRIYTVASTLIVVFVQVFAAFADVDGAGFLGVVVALYSLGAHSAGPIRSRVVALIAIAIAALFVTGLSVGELDIGSFISSTIILVTAFVLGDNLRRRRDAATALQERAERAERERELIAQREVNAERNRIARELHDVVAHSVSVMVIQAAAARRSLSTAPDNAEQALTNIEETGRQTMNELRGILGVLRRSADDTDAEATLAPQPALDQIDDLVARSDDLAIDLTVVGDVQHLPSSVTLTGYRVIQEALTNIRRHAGPVTSVAVTIERRADEVAISVTDDGRGAAADDSEPGFGLVGMNERVAAIGGTMHAGWRSGGGWRVAVSLPTDASAAPRSPTTAPSAAEVVA
ncbi:sensor histidine kinase [Ilumatobacter coccineus]|uniref:histidine kinase n=1 Tax=Ilumatobacter coccineus (strain NBRC 103263 / KCTC 29153 / YM16-304) TaxID=1313172 RepID=A0A6C7EAI6_ILUCY|nr:sensor histidine kinase [Ilumatobacter coccineus]BAN03747.1 putative two-component histidine kinase [Ilumatobacter coccineus YM16-304]